MAFVTAAPADVMSVSLIAATAPGEDSAPLRASTPPLKPFTTIAARGTAIIASRYAIATPRNPHRPSRAPSSEAVAGWATVGASASVLKLALRPLESSGEQPVLFEFRVEEVPASEVVDREQVLHRIELVFVALLRGLEVG